MESLDYETEDDSATESCVSPEGCLLPSNTREVRNRAEKMRRDKLNSFIGELAALVPMVASSAKRMDKTSILRLTATHLRIYQTLTNSKEKISVHLPKRVDQYILEQLIYEQLGGLLFILTASGKIVFVSHTVEHLLGHLQTDLMGQSIFHITAPDDQARLNKYIQSNLEDHWKTCVNIHLKRAGPRTESAVYNPVKIMGIHRHCWSHDVIQNSTNTILSNPLNEDVLICFVRILRPEPISEKLVEASKDEYITRHLIDGRIIDCDQRISYIAGYMTDEVAGLSAFKFMHREDVRWVMIALRQMYDRGESKGTSCYRLLSRNGQFIYLRTTGFLEIDEHRTVESFVCINTLISEIEGLQLIKDMKTRFSALINLQLGGLSLRNEPSLQSVEDPNKIDTAITHLMTNLPSLNLNRCSNESSLKCHFKRSKYNSTSTEIAYFKTLHIGLKATSKRQLNLDTYFDNVKRQKTSHILSTSLFDMDNKKKNDSACLLEQEL